MIFRAIGDGRPYPDHGRVRTRDWTEVPPRVEYCLTAKGEALVPMIDYMRHYGKRWLLNGRASIAVRERHRQAA